MRLLLLYLLAAFLHGAPPPGELVATLMWATRGISNNPLPVVVDLQGNLIVAGDYSTPNFPYAGITPSHIGPSGIRDIYILKLSGQDGRLLSAVTIGGSSDAEASQVAVDADGNVVIAGISGSSDLPVTPGAFLGQGMGGSFVLSWSPATGKLGYCTYISAGSSIQAIALDPSGGVYLAGSTSAQGAPTTPGAFQTAPPVGASSSGLMGFVAKLNSSGSKLDFFTLLGGSGGDDRVLGVAVSAKGSVVVTGQTNSHDFPTTAGVFQPQLKFAPDCSYSCSTGFLASIDKGGSELLFSTYTDNQGEGAIQLDNDANIFLGGNYFHQSFRKFSPDAKHLLAQNDPDVYNGGPLFVDPDGTAYLFATAGAGFGTRNTLQPCRSNLPGGASQENFDDVVTVYNPDGDVRLATFLSLGSDVVRVSRDVWHRFYSVTEPDTADRLEIYRWTLPSTTTPHAAPSCLVHAATFQPVFASPGALMTIFGSGIGPLEPQSFRLQDDRVPTQLGGVSIMVDGLAAPVLYAQDRQVNFVVPWAVASDGKLIDVCVVYKSDRPCLATRTSPAELGIFKLEGGRPAVLNQDGTINNPDHPAVLDSVVSLYLTGTGMMTPQPEDGAVSRIPLPALALPFSASLAPPQVYPCFPGSFCVPNFPSVPAPIEYAGAAPLLVSGVAQMNVRIPIESPTGPSVQLSVLFPGVDLASGITVTMAVAARK